jgi:antitoxin (DNA-binding transcriptional repressor) of toxin-antitoxin stability system
VLRLTHMEMISVRDLQQHASAALVRVAGGESLGVTSRGRLVAVLVPPSSASGIAVAIAGGRVQPARLSSELLPDPVSAPVSSETVLDDLRAEAPSAWPGTSTHPRS